MISSYSPCETMGLIVTRLWHALFCKMPGWTYPDLALLVSMREHLFKIRCKGCWHSIEVHGYEIAALESAALEDRR